MACQPVEIIHLRSRRDNALVARQLVAVCAKIVGRLVDNDHVRLEARHPFLKGRQERTRRIAGNPGIDIIEVEMRPALMKRLPDEVRPRHFIAADFGAIGRRAAEEGQTDTTGRFVNSYFRAPKTEGVDRNRTKMPAGDRDPEVRRPVDRICLFDPPEVAVPDLVSAAHSRLGEHQQHDADAQERKSKCRRSPPSGPLLKARARRMPNPQRFDHSVSVGIEPIPVIKAQSQVLILFPQEEVADDERIDLATHEAAECIVGGATDRLATHIEASVDQNRTAGD